MKRIRNKALQVKKNKKPLPVRGFYIIIFQQRPCRCYNIRKQEIGRIYEKN